MAIYFNESEPKMILLKSNNKYIYDDFNISVTAATKDDIDSLLAEIEFLNKEIDLLKRKIKRKSRKW